MYGTAPRIEHAQPGPLVLDPAAASRRTMAMGAGSTATMTQQNLAAQAQQASFMQQAAVQQQMQMHASQYQRGMNSLHVADDMFCRAARDKVQGTLLVQQQMALLAQQTSAPQPSPQQQLQQMQVQQQMQQLQLKHMQQAGYGVAPAQTSAIQSPTNIPGAYGQPSQPQQQAPQAFGQDTAAQERQQQSSAGNANVNMTMYGNLMGNMGNDSSRQFSSFYTAALQIAQQQQHAVPTQQLAEGMLGSMQHTHLHAPQVHTPEQTHELLEGPMIQALMRAAAPDNVFKYNPDDHHLDNVHLWKGFGKSKVPPGSYVAPDGTLVAGEGSKIIVNHGGKVTNIGAHVANLYGECTNIRGRTDNYFGTVHNAEGIVVNNGGRVHNLRGYVENLEGEVANYCGDVRNVRGDVQNEQGRVQNEGGRVLNHRGSVASLGGVIDNYYGDVACISSAVKNRQGVVHGYGCEISNEMGLCNNEQGNCVNVGGLVENKHGFVQNYAGYVRNNSPVTCPHNWSAFESRTAGAFATMQQPFEKMTERSFKTPVQLLFKPLATTQPLAADERDQGLARSLQIPIRGSEGGGRAQDSSVEAQSPRMSNNAKGDKSACATSFPGPVYKPTRSMSPPSPASTSGGHTGSRIGMVYNATRSATSPRRPPPGRATVIV